MNKFTFVFIIVILILYFNVYKAEYLMVTSETDYSKKADTTKIDMLEDPLFKDVIFYQNDIDSYADGKQTGLEKCLDLCHGKCVEFGVTGSTFCFPSR